LNTLSTSKVDLIVHIMKTPFLVLFDKATLRIEFVFIQNFSEIKKLKKTKYTLHECMTQNIFYILLFFC